MRALALGIVATLGVSTIAHAGHHDSMQMDSDEPSTTVTAGVSLLAADFDSMYYDGDYQGIIPSIRWSHGWVSAGAMLPFYRLEANGLTTNGVGDAMVDVNVRVLASGGVSLRVVFAVSVPTGDEPLGYGMGHLMLMPAAIGTWTHEGLTLSASAGYGRAVADLGAHNHGMWPLVEPMNMSEVTFGGGGDIAVTKSVRGGVRLSGGAPVGAVGITRLIGAARISWGNARVETGAELQTGIVGDPFSVRAVVETGVRF